MAEAKGSTSSMSMGRPEMMSNTTGISKFFTTCSTHPKSRGL
eukprot:CAMPEP_0180534364 /NCGR_PEP_ID=MMETSP1036_2-20121128/64131_1 /TAXON_ID=632150 /ORGANISM="Azadinium spinosum, Strain 3D9" /LENGTH=41 /DNA_ID= /DNA_START= /DNA_END= /DNA_ORIENTATION=